MKKFTLLLFVLNICFADKHNYLKETATHINASKKPAVNKTTVKKQIPIMAFVGVPQHRETLARYYEMRDAGITLSYVPFLKADEVKPALDMAQKAGIKLFISCPELISNPETIVKRFMNHPAVAGYYLKDEPAKNEFSSLKVLVNKIKAIDKNHICYVNLLPTYAEANLLGTATYQAYLDSFIKEVPVPMLSFDHYPIIGNTNQSIRADWYNNLEMVAQTAKKYNKPFWAFALTTAFASYPLPTLATIRLQVYSDLAYGAQVIQYFTYWTISDPNIDFHNAAITDDGKQTDVYQKVKQVSAEIKALSSVFYGAKMISVAHTGNVIPAGTKPLKQLPKPILSLKTDGLGAIVSVLKNNGNTYLVVVNRDFVHPVNLTIKVKHGVNQLFKAGSSITQKSAVSNTKISAGDLALYVWPDDLN
ncbi:MAG: hypothetical protein EOP43_05360 [Sphingobacteriaceae bacterium]|nr:MAG: hypothetical protein EOP43_05360 [Sphingobacteriaceae bacterium]